MKGVIWVLAIALVILAVIFFGKKDDSKMTNTDTNVTNSETREEPEDVDKVFVNSAGEELKIETRGDFGEVKFASIGSVKLQRSQTASGVKYHNEDETLVFWDRGVTGELSQNGVVVFEGTFKSSSSN
ncbi:MAG: hypothetical protein R3B55_03695 [Candidatus Paceibacterota bacterium]